MSNINKPPDEYRWEDTADTSVLFYGAYQIRLADMNDLTGQNDWWVHVYSMPKFQHPAHSADFKSRAEAKAWAIAMVRMR